MTDNTDDLPDDLPEPDFPQRSNIIQFPNHPVSPDGFIKSRIVSDRSNRSATLTFKLAPDEARQLEELVVLYRDEGYRTVSDILRHAARDHITRLLDSKTLKSRGTLDNTWAVLQMNLDQMRDDMLSADWKLTMDTAEDYIRLCQGVSATGEIRKYLRKLRHRVHSINNEFWRAHWSRELHRRWGEYL